MLLEYIYKKIIFKKIFSDWPQESDLIETFCMARRILGLWHFPKNPQNVSFLPLSLSRSLALFFPLIQWCLTSAYRAWVWDLKENFGEKEKVLFLSSWLDIHYLELINLWTNGLKTATQAVSLHTVSFLCFLFFFYF